MSRVEGVINMLKPAGMTSHDAVGFLRRLSGEKKIGHTGTLDPMAAGVLPLCVGNATRIIEYMDKHTKSYRCQIILGVETDTLDIWGHLIKDKRDKVKLPDTHELNDALQSFVGKSEQVPPQYSAIKIRGKPMYNYARQGQEILLKPRPITVYSCRLISHDKLNGRVMFDVSCSPGTYIRSLCRDLGELVGTGGAMSFLLRTGSGPFTIEEAKTMEELKVGWRNHLLSSDYALDEMGALLIPEGRRKWFGNGGYLRESDVVIRSKPTKSDRYRVYCGEDFMGTVNYSRGEKKYLADKVFKNENI